MELDTKRLILRPILEIDADPLHPLINDPDVAMNMLNIPNPYPDDMLLSWIRATILSMEHEERLDLTVLLKSTNTPIGVCSINQINWEHMNAEVGYWLGKPYWGNGYMT
ncbi:MAG: GNAT family N-acetyltransferase, partial [Armatimonadota bacterium]